MSPLSATVHKAARAQPGAPYDAVVVGAGPYGLSTAAHLIGKGLKVAVFGKPLQLWREYMPQGMLLRSHWWATNLSDPEKKFTFEKFFDASGYRPCYPVPIQMFIDYGLWFQKNAVPNVDETFVSTVERDGERFALTLANGRAAAATSVVIAAGLRYYANVPAEYAHLPAGLVSHTFEHSDLKRFAGRRVAMIGGGQSAVEYSALLHEAGAQVSLIARRPIRWLPPDADHRRRFMDQLRAPRAGIAPGWVNWALEYFPYLFHRLPQSRKDRFTLSHYAAAANDWLRDRIFGKVELNEQQTIRELEPIPGGGVALTLSSHKRITVDHVMLATGYKVDLHRLPMLSDSLKAEIRLEANVPILNHWFETSVPGLYIVGLTSVRSFGPLYRFVVGAKAAAPRVASAVARRARTASARSAVR
jgi:cation diffusion facilitator CzcD-associated flavoprotein CzcO